jgi:hypothetical protein
MKSVHHYTRPYNHQPSRLELGLFGFVITLAAIVIGLLCLAGCAHPSAVAEVTKTTSELTEAQHTRLDQVAGAVQQVGELLKQQPISPTIVAAMGENKVAAAGLPVPTPAATEAAAARVQSDLDGKPEEAGAARAKVITWLQNLVTKVNMLEQAQHDAIVKAQQEEAQLFKRMAAASALALSTKLWILSALIIGAATFFSVPRLYLLGGVGLVIASLPFIGVSLMGNPHYDLICYSALALFAGIVAYAVWHGVEHGDPARASAALKKTKAAASGLLGGASGLFLTQLSNAWQWAHDLVVKAEQFFLSLFKKPAAPATPPARETTPGFPANHP